jgi:MFS family permease
MSRRSESTGASSGSGASADGPAAGDPDVLAVTVGAGRQVSDAAPGSVRPEETAALTTGPPGEGGGPPPTRRLRLGALWKNPDFMKFWIGETISLFGTRITALALSLTAVITLRATPQQLGLLRAIEFAPFLFLTLLAGIWVDRHRRRPIMIAANTGRAILIGLVPLLSVLGVLRIELLYVISFSVGFLTLFFDVSWLSYVPSLVSREHLVEGNSKLVASSAAAEVGGPGLAGVLVQVLTAPIALVVDAASYVVSLITLLLIRKREPIPERKAGKRNLLREIAEGFRTVFGNPYLRAIAAEGAAFNLFYQFIETIFVLYAIRELGFSPSMLGLVVAVGSVGGLLGAALASMAAARFRFGPTLTAGMAVACLAPLLLPLASGSRSLVAIVLTIAFFGNGVGAGTANVLAVSLRQAVTPDRLLGRMNASMRTALYGAVPIGGLLAGVLGGTIGLRPSLWVAAAGFFVALVPILVSPIPRLPSLPAPLSEEQETAQAPSGGGSPDAGAAD